MSGPKVGEMVCDCRFVHQRIAKLLGQDAVVLADGFICSYERCCDPVSHEWEHPAEPSESIWKHPDS